MFWTPKEIALLTQLRARGLSARQIQQHMPNRDTKAIENKCRHLKLHRDQPTSPKPAQRSHHQDTPRAGKTTLPLLPSLQGTTP